MAWMTAPSLNRVSTSFLTAGEAAPEVDPLAGVGGTACVCLALEPFLGCVTKRSTAYVCSNQSRKGQRSRRGRRFEGRVGGVTYPFLAEPSVAHFDVVLL